MSDVQKAMAFAETHHFAEHFGVSILARGLFIVALCLFVSGVVNAQTPDPSPVDAPQPEVRPALDPFPRFQDWSFLRDPSLRIDPYDRLKFIPLNESGTSYLTLSVEDRTEFQYLDNNAWGAGGNFGWTLPGPVWPVRFGLQADALSGDNGQPGTLGTLNAFFPRGAYFGSKFALMGPANLLSVQPQFVFHPLRNVSGTFEWIWFWRESTKDALYTFGNVPLRPASLSNARYVGSQPNLEIRWAISEHFLAALNLAGFVTGAFLKQSPPSNAIVFFNLGLTYRF